MEKEEIEEPAAVQQLTVAGPGGKEVKAALESEAAPKEAEPRETPEPEEQSAPQKPAPKKARPALKGKVWATKPTTRPAVKGGAGKPKAKRR